MAGTPDRRSRRVLSAVLVATGVVVGVAAFFFLAPSGSAHPRAVRVAVTTTTVNPNKMHGNPTKPIPPGLAAMGCYTLHDGDPLPPGIVWAQPDTAFCPPGVGPGSTMPPLGPGPTTAPPPAAP